VYEEEYKLFIKRHICNIDPFPESLMKSAIEGRKDQTVANATSGGRGNQFANEGTLAGYSMIGEARKIGRERCCLMGIGRSQVMRW
jgi:L-proline amide hydrolase